MTVNSPAFASEDSCGNLSINAEQNEFGELLKKTDIVSGVCTGRYKLSVICWNGGKYRLFELQRGVSWTHRREAMVPSTGMYDAAVVRRTHL